MTAPRTRPPFPDDRGRRIAPSQAARLPWRPSWLSGDDGDRVRAEARRRTENTDTG